MFVLSIDQIAVLSFAIMVAVQGVKIWRARGGRKLTRRAITWVVLAISFVFGLLWADLSLEVALPVLSEDPGAYLMAILSVGQILLAYLVEIFVVVLVIYKYVLGQVFKDLGFAPPRSN